MSIFGWSYPAGCSNFPGEEGVINCEMCGGDVDNDECVCHECEECGEYGNPDCYENHGLVESTKQVEQRERLLREIDEQSRLEVEAIVKEREEVWHD